MLSEYVKMYMYLSDAKRYALNDRTITLLMEGGVDMSVATTEAGGIYYGRSTYSYDEVEK